MRTEQRQWETARGWQPAAPSALNGAAQLVLLFGDTALLRDAALLKSIRDAYPQALIAGCSTAGEILGTRVRDASLSLTAIAFDKTKVSLASTAIEAGGDSHAAGERLARDLDHDGLAHVLVFSDGLKVNGTELALGLRENLPEGVAVTGGLAGDGDRFRHTLVCCEGAAAEGRIAALGFYGEGIQVGYGSLGGWDPFGPERLITRAKGNVLYELDGQPALELYRKYLGEHAAGLPATALLFPLALRTANNPAGRVRTVLAIDEAAGSMTFAGDMPEGEYARLMKANFDRLVEGAAGAARAGAAALGSFPAELAVLVSCVGRKLVLKQRIEEEVEAVREVLGPQAALTGFYSYGELCPEGGVRSCELHNQTMTITAFAETT